MNVPARARSLQRPSLGYKAEAEKVQTSTSRSVESDEKPLATPSSLNQPRAASNHHGPETTGRRAVTFEFFPLAAHAREADGAELELVAQAPQDVTLVVAIT